ncbi:MAG: CesT family type III secretion system chaperone [Chlamydiia bacterium]|nr:CesT family type III secretion system chaperone [Chlamydiia bacterium]
MDLLESLLDEFGKAVEIENLTADENRSCLIKLPEDGPEIQLELDKPEEHLIIGCNLGFVPPGRYRENLFKTALLANALPPPRNGDFAFSKKSDQIVLTAKLSIKELNGQKIAAVWDPFIEKATLWTQAIKDGEVPAVHGAYATKSSGRGMFGL